MKQFTTFLLTAIAFIALTVNTNAQYLYEPFENGGAIPAGWTNEPFNDADWQFLTSSAVGNGGDIVADNTTGMTFFAFFDSWNTSTGGIGELTSPVIDLSGATIPMLGFAWNRPASGGTARLEVDIFANGTWNTDVLPGLDQQTAGWEPVEIFLGAYMYSDVQIRFRIESDYYRNIGLDDFVVIELPTDLVDWCNVQWPATIDIFTGEFDTVYTRTYESGLTDVTVGAPALGIMAWLGYSDTDSDPSTWTNWIPSTYNLDAGNDDEYMTEIGAGLPAGTYYYASRFRLNGGAYSYGGFNAGGGDFWDGTTNVSGILTVNKLPGTDCTTPIVINLPADAPYIDASQTNAGLGDDYNATCLNFYDSGEDIIYELNVASEVYLNITLDPKSTTYTGIYLDDECPDASTTCMYTSTNSSAGPHGFTGINLTAGTYYIMIDTWAAPDNIPDFDLSIDLISCPDPSNQTVTNITATSADLGWTPGLASNWYIEWDVAGFTPGTGNFVITATNPHSISGLTENTDYVFYVKDSCAVGDVSGWIGPFPFTTLAACPAPTVLTATNITDTQADLGWTTGGAPNANLEWGTAGFTPGTGTMIIDATNPTLLSGLSPETDYEFYVQDSCGTGDTSPWVSFTFSTTATPLTNPTACELGIFIPSTAVEIPMMVTGAPGTQLGVDVKLTDVNVIISHVWDADAELSLISPNGVEVPITIGNGGNGVNYGVIDGTCTTVTNFNMNGTDGPVSAGAAPFLGSFIPDGDFADFNDGSNPNGIWKVKLYDNFSFGDDGYLEFIHLEFNLLSAENDIIAYSFPEETGPAIIDAGNHTVNIEVTALADITQLTADFQLSDYASANIAAVPQESGMTINNFTNPVTYTVVAENSTTQDWVVTVTQAAISQETDILAFGFAEEDSPAMIDDINHIIDIDVVFGTDVTTLVADFTLSPGANADIGGTPQASTVTANDFTNSVIYTVTAEDGSTTQNWTVNVTLLPADPGTDCSNPLIAFEGINMADNSAGDQWFYYVAPMNGEVTITTCGFTGEDTYLYYYENLCGPWINDEDDFCGLQSEMTFLVNGGDTITFLWGEDYTNGSYEFELSFRLFSTEADIISYSFPEETGPSFIDDMNYEIYSEIQFSANITNLTADFALSMNASAEIMGVPQISGMTANDFTNSVVYTVIAEDGITTRDWTVFVDQLPASTEANILDYWFPEATGPATIDDMNHIIDIVVGIGTDVTTLTAGFVLSDFADAEIASIPQISGVTTNNFTNPVVYTVIAEDGTTTIDWTVNVTVATAPSTEANITWFGFPEETGPAFIDDFNQTIDVEIVWNADITNLTANFNLSYGASAAIGATPQTSGVDVNNFTNPVVYTVTAEDGTTTLDWTVNVTVEPAPLGAVCSNPIQLTLPVIDLMDWTGDYGDDYSTSDCSNNYMSGDDVVYQFTITEAGILEGDIDGSWAGLHILDDCPDVGTCIASATGNGYSSFSGVDVVPGTYFAVVSSWTSPQSIDFTMNLNFMAYNTETDILAYSFPEQIAPAIIDDVLHTVDIVVANGTNMTSLIADFTLSQGASATIGAVPQISGATVNAFDGWDTYTITAEDGITTQDWVIRAVEQQAELLINEVDADQTSTDTLEFIELFDGGVGNIPLDDYVVVLYNGATDAIYDAIDLDGYSTDADGYFVLGSQHVQNVDYAYFTSNGIQNGDDAVALYLGDATAFPNGGPLNIGINLIDALVYNGDGTSDPELAPLLIINQPQINENENGNKMTESMQRIPNGSGGLRYTETYMAIPPTPGVMNQMPDVIDIAIIAPTAADSGYACGMSDMEVAELMLENTGDVVIPMGDTIFCYYQIDADPVVEDTLVLSVDLNPGETVYFQFDQTIDFSAIAHYDWAIWIDYINDEDPANDDVASWVETYELMTEIEQGDTLVLPLGSFPASLNTIDMYNGYLWENELGMPIGNAQYVNIYSFGWYYVEVNNDGCSAWDSIYVMEEPPYIDLAWSMPYDGAYFAACDLTASEMIYVEIQNTGNDTIPTGDTIFMFADIEGQMFSDTLVLPTYIAPGDIYGFMFDETWDGSALGLYNWTVWFDYAADMNSDNDAASGITEHINFSVEIAQGDTIALHNYDLPTEIWTTGWYDNFYWENEDGSEWSYDDWMEVNDFGWHYVTVTENMSSCEATDSIYIEQIPPADLDLAFIMPPSDTITFCDMTMLENVWGQIYNAGIDTVPAGDTILLYTNFTGNPMTFDTIVLATELLPGDTITYISPTNMLDFPTFGVYSYQYWIVYDGDLNAANDIAQGQITYMEVIAEIDAPDTIWVYDYQLPVMLNTVEQYDEYYWNSADFMEEGWWPDFEANGFGWYYVEVNNWGFVNCELRDSVYIAQLMPQNIDLALISPVSESGVVECEMGLEVLDYEIMNSGVDPVPSGDTIFITSEINMDVILDTIVLASDLNSGEVIYYTGASYDFSGFGMHEIMIYIDYNGDLEPSNDSAQLSVEHLDFTVDIAEGDTVSIYPYEYPVQLTTVDQNYDWIYWSSQDGSETGYMDDFYAYNSGWYYVMTGLDMTSCEAYDSIFIEEMMLPTYDLIAMPDYEYYEVCDIAVDTIMFGIGNAGANTIPMDDTIIASYQVNGGTVFTDTIILAADLVSGDGFGYAFTDLYDFSALDNYVIDIEIYHSGDGEPANNYAQVEVDHIEYVVDLEAENGGINDTLIVPFYPASLDAGAGFPYYQWSTGGNNQTTNVNSDGWYYVGVWNDGDCYAEDSIFVMMLTPESIDLAAMPSYEYYEVCDMAFEEIGIAILNNGLDPVPDGDTVFVWYQVDGSAVVEDTVVLDTTLYFGDDYFFIFNDLYDFSALGNYWIDFGISYNGDLEPANDEGSYELDHIQYMLDLDAINGGVDDTLIVASWPQTLDAGIGFPYYEWSTMETSQMIDVDADGWYYVDVWNDYGCYTYDSIYVMLYNGEAEIEAQTQISVYPNPSRDFFNVEISTGSVSDVTFELINLQGQIIYTIEATGISYHSEKIDISTYAKGVYYLRVNTGTEMKIEKVIIQ